LWIGGCAPRQEGPLKTPLLNQRLAEIVDETAGRVDKHFTALRDGGHTKALLDPNSARKETTFKTFASVVSTTSRL
jgi:hypothetical protein